MQTLLELAQPFRLCKKTATLQRELNERIGALNAQIEAHQAAVNALAQAEVDELLAGDLAQRSEDLERESLYLLAQELRLRRELVPYFEACRADLSTAQSKANAEYEAARAEVTAKLQEIGYKPVELPIGLTIHPQLVLMHPRVKSARLEMDSLPRVGFEAAQVNHERIAAIEREINLLRSKAVAAAAR